jgi:hypothetical protein
VATEAQQPAPAPYRTPVPVRLALFAIAAVVGLSLVAFSTIELLDLAARHTTEERNSYTGVRALDIDDASDVRLTSAPAGSALEVRSEITAGLSSPRTDVRRREDGTLELSASCPNLFGGSCEVDYEIAVPAGTAVHVDASAGDVTAEDLTSSVPIELESSAGDITVSDVSAPELRLGSSAGDLDASGVRAGVVLVDSSAGDVSLSLRTAPERVEIESSAGDVDLVLPDETYRIDASASAGDVDDRRVRTDPASPRVVRVRSSAGDIRIEARD